MPKKYNLVQCRVCGKKNIDRNTQVEGVDWIMKSKNFFYHKQCFDQWISDKDDLHQDRTTAEWMDYAWDFLVRDVRITDLNYIKFKTQWESFLKKNMTSKGIYFVLRYFYDVQKGDVNKSQGGIGIVPFIYKEGTEYWVVREEREHGICSRIEQQLRERAAQDAIIMRGERNKRKAVGSLDEI